MNTIRDLDLAGKKVLVRVDFNVPMDDKLAITDDIRIRMALPTIKYVLANGGRLILCSHMGRPKGRRVEAFSLAPVARYLQELIGCNVRLAPDCIGKETEEIVSSMTAGEVVLLENLRFHPEETENDAEFADKLATLADVYINDAFAVSHRAHASVVGVAERVKDKGERSRFSA